MTRPFAALGFITLLTCLLAGCREDPNPWPGGPAPDAGNGEPDAGGRFLFQDFPAEPILDGVPAAVASLFGPAGTGTTGGPCLAEPQLGSLFPQNWIRPRFVIASPPELSVFEIRLHSPAQANELRVYTTNPVWKMPGALWSQLAIHLVDQPISVSIRGAGFDGVKLTTAPRRGSKGELRVGLRSVTGVSTAPLMISSSARELLARTNQQQPVFSAAHWSAGDRLALSMLELGGRWEIIWTDLAATSKIEGTAWGVVARAGDNASAAAAAWSRDGKTIAYTAAAEIGSGMNAYGGGSDLYRVPFAAGAGGAATRISGASEPGFSEIYPSFSPDDRLLAFTRVPAGQSTYNNPQAEVFVVPEAGGAPTRLVANDPVSCMGTPSPGVTNSWPKWAPERHTVGTRTYYWLTFSSTRTGRPQLFVSPVVLEHGVLTTYPALYLWNQPGQESNHTPAWDAFKLEIN